MKKITEIIMFCILVFSLTACGNSASYEGMETTESTVAQLSETESSSAETNETENNTELEKTQADALVVYFSCTGNTRSLAETISASTGADLYEIIPEQPYTEADLNYNDQNSRSSIEMNDEDIRPAISGEPLDLSEYDIIYVGYPIWWGDMPRILYTFFDTYDMSTKIIAPFCTSGSSGLSGTVDTIAELEPQATITNGLHIGNGNASSTESAVTDWLNEIGTVY